MSAFVWIASCFYWSVHWEYEKSFRLSTFVSNNFWGEPETKSISVYLVSLIFYLLSFCFPLNILSEKKSLEFLCAGETRVKNFFPATNVLTLSKNFSQHDVKTNQKNLISHYTHSLREEKISANANLISSSYKLFWIGGEKSTFRRLNGFHFVKNFAQFTIRIILIVLEIISFRRRIEKLNPHKILT